MSKFEKVFILILTLTLCIPTITNAENYKTYKFEDVVEEDVLEVPFEYDGITEEDLDIDKTKLEFLGYEDGSYKFKALQDMDEVTISLYFQKDIIEEETEHEGGGAVEVGPPTEGSGESMEAWEKYTFGKKFKSGNQYYVYLDFEDYGSPDKIYYKDMPSLNNPLNIDEGLTIIYLKRNDEEGTVEEFYSDNIKYEFVNEEESNDFIITIPTEEYDGVYISYYTSPTDNKEITNKFSVITKEEYEEIIHGGKGSGETSTEEPEEDNDPEDKEDKGKNPEDPNKSDPVKPEDDKEEPIIEEKDKPIIKEDQPNNVDEIKQTGLLPKTGEAFPTGTYTIGSSLIALGLYMLRKGRRM